MKILLLTDIPPCSNYTAGLVLNELASFVPNENLAICSVINPSLKPMIPEKYKAISQLTLRKPREASLMPNSSNIKLKGLLSLLNFIFEVAQSAKVNLLIKPKIDKFIKENSITHIWIVLQGQTMVRLANEYVNSNKLPIYTQVWDPFEWWLRANGIDNLSQAILLRQFSNAIKKSKGCATASIPMSEEYSIKYRVPNSPLIAGLPEDHLMPKKINFFSSNKFTIGISGQLYAQDTWNSFIDCLNKNNWTIQGKEVLIVMMGEIIQFSTHYKANIQYLGWRSQKEVIQILSECDLLYLPYWFDPTYKKEASTSFPSKLITYFCSGTPVFCHAPDYASPIKYLKINSAGFTCESTNSQEILTCLQNIMANKNKYLEVAKIQRECFLRDFEKRKMKTNFYKFLHFMEMQFD